MNEEELFCKLFPEYVVNGKPLSPYFDLFESGYEQAENRIEKLEAQIEKKKCLNEEIIKALNECLDYEWLHAHNGKAKYLYLQTVIDIVNEKFEEIKENAR